MAIARKPAVRAKQGPASCLTEVQKAHKDDEFLMINNINDIPVIWRSFGQDWVDECLWRVRHAQIRLEDRSTNKRVSYRNRR